MISITINGFDYFNPATNEFTHYPDRDLRFEHSLVSLSKWESKTHKSFLNTKEKTTEEAMHYFKCMLLDDAPDEYLQHLTEANVKALGEYISDSMTATTFRDEKGKPSREIVTAELIYYWMVALEIPFECQYWHLNRLLTLVRVCNIKNSPKKKMSKSDILSRNRSLNASRRAALGTSG